MLSEYCLTVEDYPDYGDMETIRRGLQAYNLAQAPLTAEMAVGELAAFVRGPGGVVLGGMYGELDWGWLYIDLAWVDKSVRGRGYGAQLIATVEQAAAARGVGNVYLATTGFQALPFYQKTGYELWGKLQDRPMGSDYYYLKKQGIAPRPVDYGFVVEAPPNRQDVQALIEGLRSHNREQGQPLGSRPLAIFVRDADGCVRGGLYGATYWSWLDLKFMWIDDELRGQGYGARMLALAEQACLARGAPHIVADTASFQSVSFYQRHGFEVFGVLDDRPPGYTSYFLKKDL